jgi:prepilin-type N-terminal cleavage/methylation domain-containing protein
VTRGRGGFTLVEMMVAIAIMAVTASLAALAFRDAAEPRVDRSAAVAAARERAIEGRRAVGFSPDSGRTELRALPDGRVLGDSAAGVDPLTGRPRALP